MPEQAVFSNTCRIVILAALLSFAGCKSQRAIRNVADALVAQPDPTVELLESELRWMEDNLYCLDDQLETSLRQLESAQRNNAALRLELAETNRRLSRGQTDPADSRRSANSSESFDEETSDVNDDPLNFTAPKIEFGVPQSGGNSAVGDENRQDADALFELPQGGIDVPQSESILNPKPKGDPPLIEPDDNPFKDDQEPDSESGQVSRIRLNQQLTGGFNSDRKAGHDGIMVVIEPQDALGRYIPVSGPVTIELRDPRKSGVAGQVGKWSFTASEIQPRIKKSLLGRGIHLELPWPTGSPTAKRLKLRVAYSTQRGKTLTTTQDVFIKPTTSALVTQADEAEQKSWYTGRNPTATRWKPTR